MARYEVTISEMINTANRIQQAADDFLNIAGQVYASAEALSQSWEGDSHAAFAAEQQQANGWYKRMVQLVNSYVQTLQKTAKAYQNADNQAKMTIRDGAGGSITGIGLNLPNVVAVYAAPNAMNLADTVTNNLADAMNSGGQTVFPNATALVYAAPSPGNILQGADLSNSFSAGSQPVTAPATALVYAAPNTIPFDQITVESLGSIKK